MSADFDFYCCQLANPALPLSSGTPPVPLITVFAPNPPGGDPDAWVAASAQTLLYVRVPGVMPGDVLELDIAVQFAIEPSTTPVLVAARGWLTPLAAVAGWTPSVANPGIGLGTWESEDINFNPVTGAGRYKTLRPKHLIPPFPWAGGGDLLAIVSAYAAGNPGQISYFPSMARGIWVKRWGPGYRGGQVMEATGYDAGGLPIMAAA